MVIHPLISGVPAQRSLFAQLLARLSFASTEADRCPADPACHRPGDEPMTEERAARGSGCPYTERLTIARRGRFPVTIRHSTAALATVARGRHVDVIVRDWLRSERGCLACCSLLSEGTGSRHTQRLLTWGSPQSLPATPFLHSFGNLRFVSSEKIAPDQRVRLTRCPKSHFNRAVRCRCRLPSQLPPWMAPRACVSDLPVALHLGE